MNLTREGVLAGAACVGLVLLGLLFHLELRRVRIIQQQTADALRLNQQQIADAVRSNQQQIADAAKVNQQHIADTARSLAEQMGGLQSKLDAGAKDRLDSLQAELNELRVLQPTQRSISPERLAAMQARADNLGKQDNPAGSKDSGAQPGAAAVAQETPSSILGAASVALFDGVGPYRKHGFFEVYGADFRERRDGPIHVTETQLAITNDEAWVFWSPDYDGSGDATALEVSFAELPKSGKLTVGFLFDDGTSAAFAYDTGQKAPPASGLLAPLTPVDLTAKASSARDFGTFTKSGDRLVVRLPSDIRTRLGSAETNRVRQWFVRVQDAAATTLRINRLALIVPTPMVTTAGVTLAGRVAIAGLQLPAEVELLAQNGERQRQQTSTDGRFRFEGIDPETPITIRVNHRKFDYYSTLGRWFIPGYSRGNVLVTMPKTYINSDGHAPDPGKAKFVGPRKPSAFAAFYEPHSRQYWPGAGKVQEYDSTTFANNVGYIDRDRFENNPDQCLRIASTGGSETVALQVRPFEKYNILLEEDLGVLLGRCVEVISAGRDNGDLGANYPRIRDYFAKLGVTYTLVSTMPAVVAQLQPQMLRDGIGWDAEGSALDSFQYDEQKRLKFVPFSPNYPVFTVKPTFPEYTKGIGFASTLSVPFSEMPEPGLSAFSYLRDVYKEISRLQPDQRLVIQTGLDQAQCRQKCQFELSLADGRRIPAGAMVFEKNLEQLCRENGMRCISPHFAPVYGDPDKHLTFEFDGHYSPRGHQWLAAELAPLIANLFKAEAGK